MDPLGIVAIVLQTTSSVLTTTKILYDLREKYKDAPMTIVSICSESNVISASLTQIQGLLLQRQDLAGIWKSRTELPIVLDNALTGCMVVFSCLDAEIERIIAGEPDPSRIRWRSRARLMWNEAKLNELLGALRGQQTAINLLIQLLQVNTLTEIHQMLRQPQRQNIVQASATITQSLQSQNPIVRVANSIYGGGGREKESDDLSVVAPSDIEFHFDEAVINSQAYRAVFARARAQAKVDAEVQARADAGAEFKARMDSELAELKAKLKAQEDSSGTVEEFEDASLFSRPITPTKPVHPNILKPRPNCRRCGEKLPIGSQFIRPGPSPESEPFHSDCPKCSNCSTPIASKLFPVDVTGKVGKYFYKTY